MNLVESPTVDRPPAKKTYALDTSSTNGKIADALIGYRWRLIGLENQLIKEIVADFKDAYRQIDLLLDNKNPILISQLSGARLFQSPKQVNSADEVLVVPITSFKSNMKMTGSPMSPFKVYDVVYQLKEIISQTIHGLLDRTSNRILIAEIDLASAQAEIFAGIIDQALPAEAANLVNSRFSQVAYNIAQKLIAPQITNESTTYDDDDYTTMLAEAIKSTGKSLKLQYNATMDKVAKQLDASLRAGKSVNTIRMEVKGIIGKNLVGPAAKLARTQVQRMATQAAKEFYDANQNIIDGEVWLATLDSKVCLVCANLDGKQFPVAKGPHPVDDTHPNCRCIRVPKVKSWQGLGVDMKDIPPAAKKQLDGVAPERVTFADWLFNQDEATQKEVLGATRFELYTGGDLDITDFVKNNKLLSIKQLRKRYKLDV
jgi:SPP1 gp7 family putative phage head morphogenesis protein